MSVSDTVAVQLEAELTGTEDGEQATEVPEVRLVTVKLASPWLPEWSTSPEYVPVRVCGPSDPGLARKDTEHESVLDSGSVQLVGENVPSPPEKATLPEGRDEV